MLERIEASFSGEEIKSIDDEEEISVDKIVQRSEDDAARAKEDLELVRENQGSAVDRLPEEMATQVEKMVRADNSIPDSMKDDVAGLAVQEYAKLYERFAAKGLPDDWDAEEEIAGKIKQVKYGLNIQAGLH